MRPWDENGQGIQHMLYAGIKTIPESSLIHVRAVHKARSYHSPKEVSMSNDQLLLTKTIELKRIGL